MSWIESIQNAQLALSARSWDLCHEWLEQALRECEQQEESLRRCLVMNNLGVMFRRIHDADHASLCFEQALQGCPEPWLRGRVFANWAVLEHRRGELAPARRYYQDALSCCSDPVEDELAVARVCVNFAWLHLQQDRQIQADTLLKRARTLVQRHPQEKLLECRLHLGMGRSAQASKRLGKAEVEILQAIRVAQKLPYFEPMVHSQARTALATCYSFQAASQLDQADTLNDGSQRRDQAEILFTEALTMLQDWGQRISFEYVETLSHQLDHYILMKQWPQAEGSVQQLLSMVTEMRSLETSFKATAWERAALVLRQLDQHDLAELARQRWQELNDLGKKSRT